MPIILVVDDSETDRKLVGGLLKPKLDWIIEYAENGAEAFDLVGQIFPDIVITDLQMPEMDGIQLCAACNAEYPRVPIVLITGKGSEELAVEALAAGAVSYVPKSALANSLMETVEQILALANRDKSIDWLLGFATQSRYQFDLENDQDLIAPLIDFVSSRMKMLGLGTPSENRHVSIAIEEVLINAMFHGNLALEGNDVQIARRAMHDGRVASIVKERSQEEPHRDRRIKFGFELSRNTIDILISDEGEGFDAAKKTAAAAEVSQLSGAGSRGLTLIGNFMDEVEFNKKGNEVRMTLKLRPNVTQQVETGLV